LLCIVVGVAAQAFISSGEHVDAMLLDIMMPGMSGLEVLATASPFPVYPVVAMTGHADAESQDGFRYLSHGARVECYNCIDNYKCR
jgi:CheY-like chemotaxis protein